MAMEAAPVNPLRCEWRPTGPRLHWAAFILLACCAAVFGAFSGHLYALVLGWWTAP